MAGILLRFWIARGRAVIEARIVDFRDELVVLSRADKQSAADMLKENRRESNKHPLSTSSFGDNPAILNRNDKGSATDIEGKGFSLNYSSQIQSIYMRRGE